MPEQIYVQAKRAIGKEDWRTPPWVVRGIEALHGIRFTLDAAADPDNAQAPAYLSIVNDGLTAGWGRGDVVWLNPPYSPTMTPAFMEKAAREARRGRAHQVWCIIPDQIHTKGTWGEGIWKTAAMIRPIIGRVNFLDDQDREVKGVPHGSVLVQFLHGWRGPPVVQPIDRDELKAAGLRCITNRPEADE